MSSISGVVKWQLIVVRTGDYSSREDEGSEDTALDDFTQLHGYSMLVISISGEVWKGVA